MELTFFLQSGTSGEILDFQLIFIVLSPGQVINSPQVLYGLVPPKTVAMVGLAPCGSSTWASLVLTLTWITHLSEALNILALTPPVRTTFLFVFDFYHRKVSKALITQ